MKNLGILKLSMFCFATQKFLRNIINKKLFFNIVIEYQIIKTTYEARSKSKKSKIIHEKYYFYTNISHRKLTVLTFPKYLSRISTYL